jgi:hypothetical protein
MYREKAQDNGCPLACNIRGEKSGRKEKTGGGRRKKEKKEQDRGTVCGSPGVYAE